ncbi:MAG: hypothetical protein WD076_00785 [Parvularculaceae bacterium]
MRLLGAALTVFGVLALLFAPGWILANAVFCNNAFKAGLGPCLIKASEAALANPDPIFVSGLGLAALITGAFMRCNRS